MKITLTTLFLFFAMYSIVGAASDDDASTRKNLSHCFIVLIIAIVTIYLL